METYKQLMDLQGDELVAVCKQKKERDAALKQAEDLLMTGADVNHSACKPMYFAVKNYNFPLIRLLIKYGALDNSYDSEEKRKSIYIHDNEKRDKNEFSRKIYGAPDSEVSRKYLASMCEKGEFTQKKEDAFFETIDLAVKRTGFDPVYLAPYINMTLLMGRIDKLSRAAYKYGMTMRAAMSHVKMMIIFEIIDLGRDESLNLINSHLDWQTGAIDLAVSKGKLKAAEYIFFKNRDITPSKESIIKAITTGNIEMLEVLNLYGINLFDEVYVKAAVGYFNVNPAPLKFLAEKGVTWMGYNGKSLYENVLESGNKKLIAFVRSLNIIQS